MTRLIAALVLAAAALPPTAAAGVAVRGIDASDYPTMRVTVVASAPSTRIPRIRENGRPVVGVDVQNLGEAKSVMLAIDRSQSMYGKPLADAVAGARLFVSRKPKRDRLAVSGFGADAVELAHFATVKTDADQALARLRVDTASGTALYDALVAGAEALAAEESAARVLIVLTDGRDVSSSANADDAVRAARAAGVIVYAIAIEGPQFSPAPLRRIARESGGHYYGASSSAQLSAIYAGLARELRRTWRLEYLTAARPGERVRVHASVHRRGVAASVVEIPDELAGADPGTLLPASFYRSRWGEFALAFGVAFLVLLGLRYASAYRRAGWLSGRLKAYHPAAEAAIRRNGRERLAGFAGIFGATERALGGLRQWRSLERMIERTDLPLRTVEFVYIMVGAGFGLAFFMAVAGMQPLMILLALPAGAHVPCAVVWFKGRKRARAFDDQLPDILMTIAASLKAGHSFRQGIQSVVDEGHEPAAKELNRVLSESRLGRPLNDALADMAARAGSSNFEFVVSAVTIQSQVGGSLANLFDMVADTVRQRQQFQKKVKALTAMGRMSAYTLVALPVFLAAAITALNAQYMAPLFTTSTGHKLLIAGVVMMAIGSLILKKIVGFKVA